LRLFIKLLTKLSLAAIVAGCIGCKAEIVAPAGKPVVYYLPYIESIQGPDSIKVGELANVIITTSSELRPGLFSEPELKWSSNATGDAVTTTLLVYIIDWHLDAPSAPASPPGHILTLPMMYSSPGQYVLRFAGVASRDEGGREVHGTYYESGFSFQTEAGPGWKIETVSINVLP